MNEKVLKSHLKTIGMIGKHLLGWFHHPNILEQSFLYNTYLPQWVSSKQESVIISRVMLWFAQFQLMEDKYKGKPSNSIRMYKHSSQFVYNKGKGGLDWSTEHNETVWTLKVKMEFEQKYLDRLINSILINLWRVCQGQTIVRPYVMNDKDKKDDN